MQFDLRSSQGIIQALQAVRNSSLDAAKQNELRDLIFLYANNGGDQELLGELNAKLADLPATTTKQSDAPQSSAETASNAANAAPAQQPATPEPYPTGRPTPIFHTPQPSNSTVTQPTPAQEPVAATPAATTDDSPTTIESNTPAATAPQPAPVSAPTPEPQPAAVSTPAPQPVAETPPPNGPTPQPPAAPPAVSEPEPPPAQAAAQAVDQPEPTTPPVPAQPTPGTQQPAPAAPEAPAQPPAPPAAASAATTSGDRDTALNRIREIKREMNALVGNPVNIIEINNEVGREYMAALLDAMKKVNGGAPGELTGAMGRLESAYQSAQKVVTPNEAGASQPQPASEAATPIAKPEPPAATHIPVKSEYAPQPAAQLEPTAPPTPAQPTLGAQQPAPAAKAAPQPKATPASPAPPTPPAPAQQPAPAAPTPAATQPAPMPTAPAAAQNQSYEPLPQQVGYASAEQPAPAAPQQPADTRSRVQELTANLNTPKPNQPAPSAPAKNQGAGNISPVAPATHELSAEPEPVNTGQKVDPNSKQVTEGLKQLLAEWSLFRSSGLFGTGPNGIDHPLYKKLANLPITNILANRYEDAKPETKQSITDYMNGWRYEQGITYEPGETFEQYLRRVITKIIETQQRTGA